MSACQFLAGERWTALCCAPEQTGWAVVYKATAEIQAIPIGTGTSVRREVQRAPRTAQRIRSDPREPSSGTNVEGDLSQILQVVERIHEVLHAEGTRAYAPDFSGIWASTVNR